MTPREKEAPAPDQRHITTIQAKRLATLAGVPAKELEGKSIAQLSAELKWKIDPEFFLFEQICGTVVKQDPLTGVDYPVPGATVYVEDTQCNFISFFPVSWPWGWFFPIFCHREVIATAVTDQCGHWCVWVPRFEIEWILRWRIERVCFPTIFKRPTIGDMLSKAQPPVVGPNPGPLDLLTALPPSSIEAIAGPAAGKLARRVTRLQASQSLGAQSQLTKSLLHRRAFETELPPPLPVEIQKALAGHGVIAAKGASAAEGIRSAIAMKLGLDPAAKEIAGFNPQHYIGPFFRCYDILLPEWQLIFEVPDISFRVTQDINGNGVQETIYPDSYFDVPWGAGDTTSVTLVASSIARESQMLCNNNGNLPSVPCGNVPALLSAGWMSLSAPYFDPVAGYALRPNKPYTSPPPSGITDPCGLVPPCPRAGNAQTPFCYTLNLLGCVNVNGAVYYRLRQSVDGGVTFTPIPPVTWTYWNGVTMSPDAQGWYEVALVLDQFIFPWSTPSSGQYVLQVQIGNAAKGVIGTSANVAFQVDNTSPTAIPSQLAWKFGSEPASSFDLPGRSLLGINCPTIPRMIASVAQEIDIQFTVPVMAAHLRDACISASGCGGGSFTLTSGTTSHWSTSGADNSVTLTGLYSLSASALQGTYSFGCYASSRAMNPDGQDGGEDVPPDWNYDPIYIYTNPTFNVAIVDENYT